MSRVVVPHVTFGQVQVKAIEAGLIMSRRSQGVTLRYRDPSLNPKIWSGLSVPKALEVVELVTAQNKAMEQSLRPQVEYLARLTG